MIPRERLAETVRAEGAWVLATLARTLGSLDLAEDAVQEAAVAALRSWPRTGVPDDPRAWLAIRAVLAGDAVIAPSATRRLVERFLDAAPPDPAQRATALAPLTPREREVLTLLGKGLSNAELAQQLYLSEATVKTHVGRVLNKLGLRDRIQAVVLAYETGLIHPGS